MATSVVGSATARAASASSVAVVRNGVTAGNALLVATAYYGSNPVPTISSSPSETWGSPILDVAFGVGSDVRLWRASSVTGGNYTITVAGDGSDYAVASVMEVNDLPSDAVDTTAVSSGNSTAPVSGTTSTPSQANTLSIAVLGAESVDSGDTNIGIDLPGAFTNAGIEQNAWDYIGFSFDYRINASASAQSASWGTLDTGAVPWAGGIAVFKANAGGGPAPGDTSQAISQFSISALADPVGGTPIYSRVARMLALDRQASARTLRTARVSATREAPRGLSTRAVTVSRAVRQAVQEAVRAAKRRIAVAVAGRSGAIAVPAALRSLTAGRAARVLAQAYTRSAGAVFGGTLTFTRAATSAAAALVTAARALIAGRQARAGFRAPQQAASAVKVAPRGATTGPLAAAAPQASRRALAVRQAIGGALPRTAQPGRTLFTSRGSSGGSSPASSSARLTRAVRAAIAVQAGATSAARVARFARAASLAASAPLAYAGGGLTTGEVLPGQGRMVPALLPVLRLAGVARMRAREATMFEPQQPTRLRSIAATEIP